MDIRAGATPQSSLRAPHVGDALPDLDLTDIDGRLLQTSSLRGRRFLLFFWGSW